MKSLAALPMFLMLATCRYEFGEPAKAVPPPAYERLSGEAGWRSRRIPTKGLEYKLRGLRQAVATSIPRDTPWTL